MRPNPLHDVIDFLIRPGALTVVFWLLLIGSVAAALLALARERQQRTPYHVAIWVTRALIGCMWWQQSLWKVPPNYAGLLYWMKQEADHTAVALQGWLVANVVIPHIEIFGPLVYAIEVAIGVSLILGLLTRWGALLGVLMGLNLWLGLYSAPGEWPWTYFFLVVIQFLFVLDPPGESLGFDTLRRSSSDGSLWSGAIVSKTHKDVADPAGISPKDDMMNSLANVLGAKRDNRIRFLTQNGKVVGIWVQAFSANSTMNGLLSAYCAWTRENEGNKPGLEEAHYAARSGRFEIHRAPDGNGYNVRFL